MAARGVRDEMVIATKFTTTYVKYPESGKSILVNYGGNSLKNLHVSVEASLRKLQTTYIDLVCSGDFIPGRLRLMRIPLSSCSFTGGTTPLGSQS